jgi:hypothetical protein
MVYASREMLFKTPADSPLSSPSVASSRVRGSGNRVWDLRSIIGRLLGLRYLLSDTWYIWASSVRSFRGHISLQSPIESDPGVGPLFVRGAEGESLQRCTRTLARMIYIEMLLATHPWCDKPDLRIFLMGFDAGEEWSCDTSGNEDRTANSQVEDSWLNLASRTFGYVPDRVHQAISVDSDQTSVVTPAAIAGVTRND